MVWRLKDKKLEADLNKFSNGEFSKRLNEVVKSGASSVSLTINDGKVAIFLDGRDLEQVPDYDPKVWNEYPAVTPPENVMMRIELNSGHLLGGFCHKFAEGMKWCYADGLVMPEAYSKDVRRFRPWEG